MPTDESPECGSNQIIERQIWKLLAGDDLKRGTNTWIEGERLEGRGGNEGSIDEWGEKTKEND